MATGMVLIIVSRNIDLSVGSLLGFLGFTMALVQTDGILSFFGLNVHASSLEGTALIWLIAIAFGVALGAVAGTVTGFIVAYGGVPAFIVTLGGFLVWRGLIFRLGGKKGQTLAPLDNTFQLLGGGTNAQRTNGALGQWPSWILGIVACAGIVASIFMARRRRQRYELAVRPMWADVMFAALGCAGRHRRGRPGGQQVHLAGHQQADGCRLPGGDPHRRHAADDLPRPAPPLRPVRVRLRRQPRGCRAGRHQHPPHRDAHLHPDGRPGAQ